MSQMKGKRWVVLPVAGLAAIIIGIVAVEAAPSPSPSASGSKNYAQVFVDKLAAILHLNSTQTKDALKQAELQTVDQMLKDGKITQQQADAMKARINAGQGLGPLGGFGLRPGAFKADRALMQELATAEANAVASADPGRLLLQHLDHLCDDFDTKREHPGDERTHPSVP